MFKKLFGTDGIRGEWGAFITPELAFEIGKAVAIIFERENEKNTIVVGRDTRLSCDVLENALISGITSMGTNVIRIGIVPTAVVPFSVGYYRVNAGIMITASHNPANHNGFKFFNGNGFRITDEQESHIEHIIANSCDFVSAPFDRVGSVVSNDESVKAYVKMVRKEIKTTKELKVCFDCANGAASNIIKEIYKGCNYKIINSLPSGLNINKACGATCLDSLKSELSAGGYDIGFAFDGDADRVRVVLGNGKVVSGENIIYYLTKYNKLNSVVTTKMSNMALGANLEKEGINCFVVDIGESAVITGMLENNCFFGGENNGHYLLLKKGQSSDGILVSAQILSIISENSTLEVPFEYFAQYEKSVSVKNKKEVMQNVFIKEKIELCESLLADRGRVLVRASGTEDVIRILVEGEDKNLVEEIGKTIEEYLLKVT